MTHDSLNWERTLGEAGLRVTRQRTAILDAVCAAGGHTPIGEIHARARKIDPTVDLSTIYRTLKVFVDLGIVVSADTGDGETRYEISHGEPHHHLVCKTCGGETEISGDLLADLANHIDTAFGFALETDHLVLHGTCAACRDGRN